MSNLAEALVGSAAAVAALGSCAADLSILDDDSVLAGMTLLRDHRRALQGYELALAAEIARRSHHALGYDGLARSRGSGTPAMFIQSMTGSSIEEAEKLARLGQSVVDAETSPHDQTSVTAAAASGSISLDAADAIRRGIGQPDDAVTAAQLSELADELIARADAMTPESLLKAARRARNDLDLAAIERGEKQRRSIRYVRVWRRDGMSGGSWALPDEDGGIEIGNALKLLVATATNGPRFADVSERPGLAAPPLKDERPPEHIMADGFAQIFHNGLTVDPSIVPGAGRAPVRVIVQSDVLADRVANGRDASPIGSAILEETLSAITFGTLQHYLCVGGTVGVLLNDTGQLVDVGREQRLFGKSQRMGLGVRDGGCRFPGCEKPPSWCEAHHVDYWARDSGATTVANGILLCRYHHMLIHTKGWQIVRDPSGEYWLKPPKQRDPNQALLEMPSRNPLVAAMKHASRAQDEFVR
jgi:Domain of unknown function (DUF222)